MFKTFPEKLVVFLLDYRSSEFLRDSRLKNRPNLSRIARFPIKISPFMEDRRSGANP